MTDERQLVVTTRGETKTGKTSFIMTFLRYGKVFLVDADRGYQDIAFKFDTANVIHRPLGAGTIKTASDWSKLLDPKFHSIKLDEFVRTYVEGLCAMRDAGGGTVGVETATQLWQAIDAWKLEEVRKRRQEEEENRAANRKREARVVEPTRLDYSECNNFMGDIVRIARDFPTVHVVFTHRNQTVYDETGHETNQTRLQGWKEMPAATSVTLHLRRSGATKNIKFDAVVEECRVDPKWTGYTLEDPSYEALKEMLA